MNRKQFQEWLEQFPEDTEIYVVVEVSDSNAFGGSTIDVDVFNGDDNQYQYADYSLYGEVFKPHDVNEERHLILGGF